MRVQWDKETFCPCCGGLCVSAKVYGLCRRLNIPEHTSKSGIFGEFQRDGGDFVWWHSSLPDCKENRQPNEAEIDTAFNELLDDIRYAEGNQGMNERNVRFEGETMDDKLCAIAIARRLHGRIWNSYGDAPQEIKILKPQALFKRVMRHGYEPIEGKDFEVAAAGTFAPSAKPQYNFIDADDDIDESDDDTDAFYDAFDRDKDKEPESCPECGSGRIYCDDAGTNNIGHYGFYLCKECGHGWTIQFETDGTGIPPADESVTPPAAPAPVTHSWRAEVVDDAIDAELEASAEAEMMEIVNAAYAEYENAIEREIEDTRELFEALHADSLAFWASAAGRRRLERRRRKMTILRGARPYQPAYELTPGVFVVGDDIRIEIPF